MSKQTTILNEWMADYNAKCTCNRGNIQLFFCDVESCKDHEQSFFCTDCVLFDFKHSHPRKSIKDELEKRGLEWKEVKEKVDSL